MIDIASLEHKDRLVLYAQELLDGLIPILKKLDPSQLSPNSCIAVEEQKGGFVLSLSIIPSVENMPSLGLWVSPNQCILDYADSEQIEAHGIPSDWQSLVNRVLAETERYLNGITVIEGYNRNHKLVGKAYYYGIDTGNDKNLVIGNSMYMVFPRKVESVVKRTHRFFK